MNVVHYDSVQSVQLSFQRRIAVVEVKVESDFHVNTYVVGPNVLLSMITTDQGSKYVCIADATVAYEKPEIGQEFFVLDQ